MTIEEIREMLTTYKKGTFTRIKYTKTFSKGYSAEVEVTSRLGCAYANLKGVEVKGCTDYARAIDADRIVYENVKSGTLYIQHEPIEHEYRRTRWFKNGVEVAEEVAIEELPKSAFKSNPSPVKRLKIENIIAIG